MAKRTHQNPKIVSIAGLALFFLGLLSYALIYVRGDNSAETLRLVAGTAVLLALGCSSLATAGVLRLEARVAELESQLKGPADAE